MTIGLPLRLDVGPAELFDSVDAAAFSSNYSGDGVTWHADLLPASIWGLDDFLCLHEVAPVEEAVGDTPQPSFYHGLVVEAAGDGGTLGCRGRD